MRMLGALRTLSERVFLLLIYGFLLHRTVISPREPKLALITWAVTFAVFVLVLVVCASMRNNTHPHYGIGRLLKRSYNSLLPMIAGLMVVFTLNALHIAPLQSETLKDQPNMLLPILIFHAAIVAMVLLEFYSGQDILPLCVAASLVFSYPIYGAANLNGYGTLFVILLALFWGRRSKGALGNWTPSPLDMPLMAFLGLASVSAIASYSFYNSSLPLTSIATSVGGALLIAGTTQTRRQFTRLVIVVASVGVALGVLGMFKLWIVATHFGARFALGSRLWLPGSDPNGVAGHLVMSIPLMLSLILASLRRWLSIALAPLTVLAIGSLVISYSKGGWLGFAASLAAFLLLGRHRDADLNVHRRRWVTIAVAMVATVLLSFVILGEIGHRAIERVMDPISLSSRAFFWRLAQHVVAEHPLIGVGMNNYYMHARIGHNLQTGLELDVRRSVLYHPHSTYLDIAEGMGVLGLCAYLFLILTFIVRGATLLRVMPRGSMSTLVRGLVAAIIGFAVHGLFDLEFCSSEWKYGLLSCIGMLMAAERVWRRETGIEHRYTNGALTRARILHIGCGVILIFLLVAIAISFESDVFWPQLATSRLSFNPQFFESLAEEKIQADEFDQATTLYEKAIARKRDYPEYHEKLGWLYWLQRDTQRALLHFKAAVDFDPLGAIGGEHYSAYALFLYAARKPRCALEVMASAIQTDPKVLKKGIWQYVPRDDIAQGDWVVRKEFITLDRDEPGSWDALREQIIAHLKGQVGLSRRIVGPETLEILSSLANPTLVPPWSTAVIQQQLYERYLDVLATDPLTAKKILLNIGKGYYYVGRDGQAESIFKEGLKFFRGDFNFRRALAVLYASQGKYKSAAEFFSQVGDGYSEGIVWLSARQYDRAIAVFSNLLSHHIEHQHPHEHAGALTMIGRIYERQGRPDSRIRARDCYEKALFLSQSAANYLRLSDILYKLGEDDRAKEMYRKALELHQAGQPLQDEPAETLLMD